MNEPPSTVSSSVSAAKSGVARADAEMADAHLRLRRARAIDEHDARRRAASAPAAAPATAARRLREGAPRTLAAPRLVDVADEDEA